MPSPRFLILALALSLAGPTSAVAEPGVTVDPRSPAGKEYAVPVDAARQIGAGRAGTPGTRPPTGESVMPAGAAGRASAPQLFGEGVEPSRQARSARGNPGNAAPGDVPRAADRRTPRAGAQTAGGSPAVAAPDSAVAPGVAARSMGTSAVAVLLGGGLLALVLRVVVRRVPSRRRVS